jgi:PAS domain S-box-containing protein
MESQPMDTYQIPGPFPENGSHKIDTMHVGNTHVALAPPEIQEAQDLQKFKLISEHTSVGVSLMDREGRFIYANQTLCNWVGYTQEEYLRLQLADRDPDYNRATYQQFFDRASQEVIPPTESKLKRKDGSTFPVEA